MATRFEIVLWGTDALLLRAAGEEVLAEISRVERQLSRFMPESEVSGVNVRAAFEAVRVDPRLFSLLAKCKHLNEATDGAFDITVAPLMKIWKLTGGGNVPDQSEIEKTLDVTGMQHIILDENNLTVAFDRHGVELDFGGVGKGYAIERAAEILQNYSIENALIHGGTSTTWGIGAPETGSWRIGVTNPLKRDAVLRMIDLGNSALSVSAIYGRTFTQNGKDYGHVIDPKTGAPAQAATIAAAAGPSPTVCDALSTALLVMGADWLQEMEKRFPGYTGLVASATDGQIEVVSESTPFMEG